MKLLKKVIISFSIILFSIYYANITATEAASQKKYGIVINIDDRIEVLDNLVVKSPKNNLMIKAKDICKELGFSYSYNSKTNKLTIKKGNNIKLVYTLGSKQFLYQEGGYSYKSSAAYPFYYDNMSKSYLIHYGTLKYIIGTKYFKVSNDDYFAEKGYLGVIYLKDSYISGLRDAETDEMLDDVIDEVITDDMSDFEKVLAINNYMVDNYEYDNEYRNYYAYDILKDKKGVCQAYAEVFQQFMDKLNIKCLFVSGKAGSEADVGGHAWNMVKLEENYYHIDVTWNDGDYENPITRSYGYFLLSDDQMAKLFHSWDSKAYPKCKKEINRDKYSIRYIIDEYFICSDITSLDNSPNIMKFYKIKYDGTNKKELFSCKINFERFSYGFDDIWLYFLSEDTGRSLNRVNLLTDEIENNILDSDFFSDCTNSIVAENNWIYFHNDHSIYRISINTLEKQEIFNVNGDIGFIEKHLENIWVLVFKDIDKIYYEIDYEGNILDIEIWGSII